jgi:hypothetical protein
MSAFAPNIYQQQVLDSVRVYFKVLRAKRRTW